jgi:selenide,water dikinase
MSILLSGDDLRAGGCNAKLSFEDLSYLLSKSTLNQSHNFDDAPPLRAARDLYASIDTLSPFTRDPYLYGKVSVVHVITDLHSVGASPINCNVNLFIGPDANLDTAAAILDGAADVLGEHKIEFSKGHSIRGPKTYLTLSVLGRTPTPQAPPKQGQTYALVLTKPLGAARLVFVDELENDALTSQRAIQTILTSHQGCLELLRTAIQGTTDVTGFGLVGGAYCISKRGFDVLLTIPKLPFLDTIAMQIPTACDTKNNESDFLAKMNLNRPLTISEHNALFGSQIAGPILMILPTEEATQIVDRLHEAHFDSAAIVGSASYKGHSSLTIE